MTTSDFIYGFLGVYLILMGVLGINLRVIWLSITFKIKVYDFEYLYGRTAARILFIILGIMILVFYFLIVKSFGDIMGAALPEILLQRNL